MTPLWHAHAPIEPGVTLLEASAGTGKTFSIADLTTRFVAERDVPIEAILLVTFTKAATAELRERVRARLSETLRILRAAPSTPADGEDVPARIAREARERGDSERVEARLVAALGRFDLASIHTIHGFCQRVLGQFGLEAGAAGTPELLTDNTRLLEGVVDDYMATHIAAQRPELVRSLQHHGVGRSDLLDIARKVEANPDARLYPEASASELAEPFRVWREAVETAQELWSGELNGVRAYLTQLRDTYGKSTAIGRTYTVNKIASVPVQVQEWVHSLDPQVTPAFKSSSLKAFHRFCTAEQLREKYGIEADHPALLAIDAIFRAAPRPATLFRVAFAKSALARLAQEREAQHARTYQDLLREVDQALAHPTRGLALRHALRERYLVGLIDEFQDTDATQWRIFQAIFAPAVGEPPRHLFLIGDPKQAIYRFRGADLDTYLEAAESADRRYALGTNWRSDPTLVGTLNVLFDLSGLFGDPRVRAEAVNTPPQRADAPRPSGGPAVAIHPLPLPEEGDPRSPAACAAREIVRLLTAREAPAQPSEIAVLARTNHEARDVQRALKARGVAAVRSGAESVWSSEEARELEWVLASVASPRDSAAARAAWSTSLIGVDAEQMLDAPEARLDAWLEAVEIWRGVAHRGGVLPLVRAILADHHTAARWLNAPDGERRLTNLLHLAELLHAEASERRLALGSVVEALAAHRADARVTEDAELRLESDAQAVQVVTVHKSKGLEYKYVLCPFLSASSRPDATRNLVFRDGEGCVLDLQLDLADAESALRAAQMEQAVAWEGARLLYVALTRARHQVHLWCAPALGSASALQAMLLGRQSPSDPYSSAIVDASEANAILMARLEALQAESGLPEGGLRVIPIHDQEALAPPPVPVADPPGARQLGHRDFDTQWRRASFTSLVRGAHAPPEAGSPEDRGAERDDRVEEGVAPEPEVLPEERPLSALARGAETGVFLHAVLERADFALVREEDHLESIAAEEAERAGLAWPADTARRVLEGLRVALETPLGPAVEGRCLREISLSNRLNELDFELPVWGGWDSPRAQAMRPAALADALGVGPGAPPASWREQIAHLGSAPLRGFLTGSIDLVFRAPSGDRARWFLVDWKSNDLARGDRREAAWTSAKVHNAMVEHHYYLQYHLYAVALRRFLRSRLGSDFDWDRDFGGVLYIFLRGLDRPGGPLAPDGTPVPIFTDRPPASRLDAIDAVLGGGAL